MKTLTTLLLLAAATALAEPINILTLGAKNDGSADISAIVNENTAKGPLYFPAGIYKVAQPITLKNRILGAGYSRYPRIDASRTWLVSDISCEDGSVGILNFGGDIKINVENLNLKCFSRECGIRIGNCTHATSAYIDKVGIYNVAAYGLFINGVGSRSIFASDMTIFGSGDHPEKSVAIHIKDVCDCRLTNIEMMGTCIGLNNFNGHTYGDNLHIWTGVIGREREKIDWWKNSRSIVMGPGSNFSGSEIYPDTSYHAIEAIAPGAYCEIANIMSWEDNSIKNFKDRTGTFFKRAPGDTSSRLIIRGGLIGVGGNDAAIGAATKVYSPDCTIQDVLLKSDYAIRSSNIDRLCIGNQLPDYTVSYSEKGYCHVADIFTVAKTGDCRCILTLQDGAAYRLSFTRTRDAKLDISAKPLNDICNGREVKWTTKDNLVKVYVQNNGEPLTAHLQTIYMNDYFRPLDHSSLRTKNGLARWHEVLPSL